MSLHPGKFWYVAGNDRIDFGLYGGYPIDWPSGVDGISPSISTVSGIDGIGSEIQTAKLPERIMSFNGYLTNPYPEEDRRKLRRVFAPMKPGRLYVENLDREVFYLDCYASTEPTIQGKRQFPRFLVQITAGYPYWQSVKNKTFSLPLIGTVSTETVNVESDVDAVYSVIFRCTGSCKNIALSDGSGKELRYSGSLSPGETLEISVSPFGQVTAKIGDGNVIGLTSAYLKKIPTGNQALTLAAEENSGTITAEITYREARAGV